MSIPYLSNSLAVLVHSNSFLSLSSFCCTFYRLSYFFFFSFLGGHLCRLHLIHTGFGRINVVMEILFQHGYNYLITVVVAQLVVFGNHSTANKNLSCRKWRQSLLCTFRLARETKATEKVT